MHVAWTVPPNRCHSIKQAQRAGVNSRFAVTLLRISRQPFKTFPECALDTNPSSRRFRGVAPKPGACQASEILAQEPASARARRGATSKHSSATGETTLTLLETWLTSQASLSCTDSRSACSRQTGACHPPKGVKGWSAPPRNWQRPAAAPAPAKSSGTIERRAAREIALLL